MFMYYAETSSSCFVINVFFPLLLKVVRTIFFQFLPFNVSILQPFTKLKNFMCTSILHEITKIAVLILVFFSIKYLSKSLWKPIHRACQLPTERKYLDYLLLYVQSHTSLSCVSLNLKIFNRKTRVSAGAQRKVKIVTKNLDSHGLTFFSATSDLFWPKYFNPMRSQANKRHYQPWILNL